MQDSFEKLNTFDTTRGIIRIGTEINSRVLFKFNEFITSYYGVPSHLDGEITLKNKTLTLEIASVGGDIFEALNMYQVLKRLADRGVEVHTVGYGLVASAAVVIYCGGSKRYAPSTTRFMIHQPFFRRLNSLDGKDLEIYGKVLQETEDDILQVFVDTFKKDKEMLKKDMKKKDFYLQGDSAVKYGLVTNLI